MQVEVQDAFKEKKEIVCKYIPKFPAEAEREYIRLTNEYMRLLKKTVEEYLPEMKEILWEEIIHTDSKESDDARKKRRTENFSRMSAKMEELFRKIRQTLESRMGLFDIARRMRSLSNKTRLLTVKEWKKAIGKALGIDIRQDYYLGDFYQQQLEKWVSDNVDLIKSIPKDCLTEMKQVIYEGYVSGKPVTAISKDIQSRFQVSKSKARLIARDQMGKLNADITKHQQTDAGIRKYMWRTSEDSRVRKSHMVLNKEVFSWDDPPVVDKKTGRRCHPGEDYQCRCIAIPVFEYDNVHLPV